MAIHKSAKKRIRRNARVAKGNKSRISQMRGTIRKVEAAITAGDKAAAQAALKEAQPKLQRAGGKGLIHKKTASRRISRLAQRIKALSSKK